MADLKIYNNGENKILMSAGDRIIRQPYEFGNAFQNRVGLNNYIRISNLNISSLSHSVGMWWNQIDPSLGNRYLINFRNTTNSAYYLIAHVTNTTDAWPFVKFNNISAFQGSLSYIGKIKNSFFIKNGSNYCRHWLEGSITSEFTAVNDTNAEWFANEIYVGAVSDTIGGTLAYNSGACLNNTFILFDRMISDSEIKYHVNNMNGRELQSVVGLYVYLRLDFAEILDFSLLQDGSDLRVGCRDYSGFNRHGQIMNLPVGSLADKLAFANANLFVPFIQ